MYELHADLQQPQQLLSLHFKTRSPHLESLIGTLRSDTKVTPRGRLSILAGNHFQLLVVEKRRKERDKRAAAGIDPIIKRDVTHFRTGARFTTDSKPRTSKNP